MDYEEELQLRKGFVGLLPIGKAYRLIIPNSIETTRQVLSRVADAELTNMFLTNDEIIVGNCCSFGIDEDGEAALYLTSTPYNPIFNQNNFAYYLPEIIREGFVTLKDREANAIRKGVLDGRVGKHLYSKLTLEKDHNYAYYKSNYAERGNRKPEELSLEEHVRDGNIQVPPLHITLPSREVVEELASKHMIAFFGAVSQNIDRLEFDTSIGGLRLATEGFYIFGQRRKEPLGPLSCAVPEKGKVFLM